VQRVTARWRVASRRSIDVSNQNSAALVSSIYDAFLRADVDAILSRLSPDAELVFEAPAEIPWSGTRRGQDGWRAFFHAVAAQLDGVEFVEAMTPFAVQDDRVVCVGRYAARVKATGKRIDSPLVHLWTIRNGLVVRCEEFTNTAVELAACGTVSAAV
jgi:ketosteroid isomerase-like protein